MQQYLLINGILLLLVPWLLFQHLVLVELLISGILSDKFGRKPFVQLGIATYFIFFVGILFSKNVFVAYILGILAGMANSFLDTGTYPGLMEIYPNAKVTSNVILKAFI